jgi:hypothetical protein
VYPKLPRLEALQDFRREAASRLSPCALLSDAALPATRPVQPELRLVVTEDLDRLKQLPTASDCQEEDSHKLFDESSKRYVQSYYYRKHDGCPTWSRRLL